MKTTHKYRPDIDGLRALAILPVLLFHAGLGCPGGFVGVDVFFVISGFLITSLILEEIGDGTFSVARFWERRIRRILPALSAMVFVTVVVTWFLYLPADFALFGQSVVAQSLLASNLFFWQHIDYFSPSQEQPLLHTWSLAVEEQFYVIFPLVLMALARSRRFSMASAIRWLFLGLFVIGCVGPFIRERTSFFLLPTRAWELMLGAVLAGAPPRQHLSRRLNEAAALAGFALIMVSAFCYTGAIRFPGLAAAPPCAGAALIIFAGTAGPTLIGRFLTLKPVVFIGLISYPLYLWHWPVLVFANYFSREKLSWEFRLALLAASVVLATISWRLIEIPFRKRWIWPRASQAFAFAACSQLILLIAGAVVAGEHGMPSRLPPQALQYYAYRNHYTFRNDISPAQAVAGDFAGFGAPGPARPIDLVLWGDSHAMMLAPMLDELCRRYSLRGVEATHAMTAPILGYDSKKMWMGFHGVEKSLVFSQAVGDFIAKNHVKIVVLAACWSIYDPPELVDAKLMATIHTLQTEGVRVYLVRDLPAPGFDAPRFVTMAVFHHEDLTNLETSPEKYAADNRDYEPMFAHAAAAGATVLDPSPCLLNTRGYYDIVRGDTLLYWDANHLTTEASLMLAPVFEPLFLTNRPAMGDRHRD